MLAHSSTRFLRGTMAALRPSLLDIIFCRAAAVASSTAARTRAPPGVSPVRSPSLQRVLSPADVAAATEDSPSLPSTSTSRFVKVLSLHPAAVSPDVAAAETLPASPQTALSSLRQWNRHRGTSSPTANIHAGKELSWNDACAPRSSVDSPTSGSIASPVAAGDPEVSSDSARQSAPPALADAGAPAHGAVVVEARAHAPVAAAVTREQSSAAPAEVRPAVSVSVCLQGM